MNHDAIGHCTFCPRLCRSACPVETASARESLTPRAKMVVAGAIAEHGAPAEAAEVLYGCSDCGACESMCLHHNPVGETLYAARALAEQPAPMREVRHRFEKHGNPFGRPLVQEQRALRAHTRKASQAPLLLLGCHAVGSEPSLAKKAVQLAERMHPDVQVPELMRSSGAETFCCGRVLQEAGEVGALTRHRELMREQLQNADEIWVLEATCLDGFVAMGTSAPVRLFAEVLAASQLMPLEKLPSIAVHTGCGTHRHAKAEEAVIALAQRASDDVRIPPRDLPFAGCCGGRGGIAEVMPEVAKDMALGRQDEIKQMGASVQVGFSTCCNGRLGLRHVLDLYA